MNTIFLKETDRKRKNKERIIEKYKFITNRIDIIEENEYTFFYLPINASKKIRNNKIIKITNCIVNKLDQAGTNSRRAYRRPP